MTSESSAGVVIFRKERKQILYLLLHYQFKTDYWDFPKGNIEEGESEEIAAMREIKEETGIKNIKFIDGFKEKISYVYKKGNDTVFKNVVFYLAETKSREVEISFEHAGYEWVDFETATKRLKENSRKVLMKAYEFLNKGLSKWI